MEDIFCLTILAVTVTVHQQRVTQDRILVFVFFLSQTSGAGGLVFHTCHPHPHFAHMILSPQNKCSSFGNLTISESPSRNGSLLKLLSEILCPEFRCGCPPIARSVRSLCPCVGWRTRGARDLGAAGPRAVPGLQSHQSWEGELQWREKAGRPTFCDLQNSKPKSELQPRRTRTQESL